MFHLTTVTKLKLISMMLGMMFWYGIEQLFMDKILLDPNVRALTTTIVVATLLVLDIPGGIIADRFGRRKTIILGAMLQLVGILIMGISSSVTVFLVGVFFYGMYWALCNGAAQAMMYDHLASIDRHTEYARHQGSAYAYGYVGAGIANILSGVVTHFFDLRAPYLLSLIPSLLALVLAMSLREVHSRSTGKLPKLATYPKQVIATIRTAPIAGIYSLQIIFGVFVFMTICEFGQILLLSYGITTIQLGILWAIDAALVAVGLHYAHRFQRWPWQTTTIYAVLLTVFALFQGPIGILLFMLVYTGTEIVHNVSETELQHATRSPIRATVLSSTNFVGNLLALAMIWVFNNLLQSHGIHAANRVVALLMTVLFGCTSLIVYIYTKRQKTRLASSET